VPATSDNWYCHVSPLPVYSLYKNTNQTLYLQYALVLSSRGEQPASIHLLLVDCYSLVSGLVKGVVMSRPDDDDLLTVQEIARRYRVDDSTVRRWINSGALEAITLPGRGKRQVFRVKKSSLRKFDPEFE